VKTLTITDAHNGEEIKDWTGTVFYIRPVIDADVVKENENLKDKLHDKEWWFKIVLKKGKEVKHQSWLKEIHKKDEWLDWAVKTMMAMPPAKCCFN